ncbi:hypothetical protein F5Y14DRAFT_54838 [Nemania sp. NC0429]|nr:hypothetical protein F5Y14DRAFT_54838 [Nemania sp. NC0429]
MSPPMRGTRSSNTVGAGEDEVNRHVSAGIGRTVGGVPGLVPGESAPADEETEEINALLATPQASTSSNTFFNPAELSRPITRSARKGHFDSILVESSPLQSQALNRLHFATTRNGAPATTTSNLEEARDIHYGPTEGDEENDGELQNNRPKTGHSTVDSLWVPRRSDRIRAKAPADREGSPSTSTALAAATTTSNRIRKRRKTVGAKTGSVRRPPRRSARLAKPLDAFYKFPELPPELQLMVWEAAIEPRLAYICNRSSILGHAHDFGIQNKLPSWFMACRRSSYIAVHNYQTLFGQIGSSMYPAMPIPLRAQAINPFVDVVIFEPCHNGCRGYYCAQQYRREDRAAVQRLAVQIDSPHLPPMSEPGWVTISRSWPNVETLFMMKPAVKGLDQSDKAMILIKEGDHELALRKRFESWKKGDGQNSKLATLEFVRVVRQELETKNIRDRYQSVEDRRTGLIEDIILG